jgi:hypothetical protein
MHTGQNFVASGNLVPQVGQARISRGLKSSFLRGSFPGSAGSTFKD